MATRSLSKPAAAAAKKPTRAQFDAYLQLDAERKELNRRAAALAKEQGALGEQILAYCAQAGGKERTVTCCGHRASIVSERRSPYWLQEFQQLAGADRVKELRDQQPFKDRLEVEKV